jgi:hypothetical protein
MEDEDNLKVDTNNQKESLDYDVDSLEFEQNRTARSDNKNKNKKENLIKLRKNGLIVALVLLSLVGAVFFVKYALTTTKESKLGTYESAKKAVDSLFEEDSDTIIYNVSVDSYNNAKTNVESMQESTKKVALSRRLKVAKPQVESQEEAKKLVLSMYLDGEKTKPNLDRDRNDFIEYASFPINYNAKLSTELWDQYVSSMEKIKEAWELEDTASLYYINGSVPDKVTVVQIKYLLEKVNQLNTSSLKTRLVKELKLALTQAEDRDAIIEKEYQESISISTSIKKVQDSISESKQVIENSIRKEQEVIAESIKAKQESEYLESVAKEESIRASYEQSIEESRQNVVDSSSSSSINTDENSITE